ncbi:hypothetical protein EGJ57_22275 [Brucella anthropi]|nr:hypothetical protein EGJ57_22275 [Brucella anthropi]
MHTRKTCGYFGPEFRSTQPFDFKGADNWTEILDFRSNWAQNPFMQQGASAVMIEEARKIVGSSEIWPLAVVATYEDFDSPSATQRYTETLYKAGHAGYYLMIMRDLFEVSQDAAFSWLNSRGFYEVVIGLYCDLEGSEIERPTEGSDAR